MMKAECCGTEIKEEEYVLNHGMCNDRVSIFD